MPLFSARIPFQKLSTPLPMQVIGPIPVMTQRLPFMLSTFVSSGIPDAFSCIEAFDWRHG